MFTEWRKNEAKGIQIIYSSLTEEVASSIADDKHTTLESKWRILCGMFEQIETDGDVVTGEEQPGSTSERN